MAVGTLAAYSTFGSKAVMRAYAQEHKPVTVGAPSGQTNGLAVSAGSRFPPGNLGDDMLPKFEQTSGLTVLMPTDSMPGIWSPGVVGLLSPEAALQKILIGTGIGYRYTGETDNHPASPGSVNCG